MSGANFFFGFYQQKECVKAVFYFVTVAEKLFFQNFAWQTNNGIDLTKELCDSLKLGSRWSHHLKNS